MNREHQTPALRMLRDAFIKQDTVARLARCTQAKVSQQLTGARPVTADVADAVVSLLKVDRDTAFPVESTRFATGGNADRGWRRADVLGHLSAVLEEAS
jgi:hypothetical protein